MSDSVRPHRQQPTRLPRPWDSPGKNTGVGCHLVFRTPHLFGLAFTSVASPTLLMATSFLLGPLVVSSFCSKTPDFVPPAYTYPKLWTCIPNCLLFTYVFLIDFSNFILLSHSILLLPPNPLHPVFPFPNNSNYITPVA